MSNRFYGVVIAVVACLFLLWNAVFIVNQREQAVVLRFGQIKQVAKDPGLYFKLPFAFLGADNVEKLPDRLLRLDLDNIRLQVSGGKFYEVDAFLVYNIEDAARFMQSVSGSITQAEQRLRTRLDAALRRVYGLRGFEAALSEERTAMMREVRDQIRPDAAQLGIAIDDVRILRTDLTQEVSQQTYERMKAERLAEAERLRARGQVKARQIRAAADRDAVEVIAAAQKQAEILQGEGEAERTRIFGEAYTKNQGFFEFYRSMKAYRDALVNSGTTMVLSPDSEFFHFFNDPGAVAGGAPTARTGAEPDREASPEARAGSPAASATPPPAPAAPAPAAPAAGAAQ